MRPEYKLKLSKSNNHCKSKHLKISIFTISQIKHTSHNDSIFCFL